MSILKLSIIAIFCYLHKKVFCGYVYLNLGQQEAEQGNLIATALEHLDDNEPVLRQWLAIALGRVWDSYEPARWRGARNNAHEKLFELLKDPVAEVRAAAVFALPR